MAVFYCRHEKSARRLRTARFLPGLSLAGLLAVGVQPAPAQESTRHVLVGETVAIYNIAGEAFIAGGSGEDVVVEVMRSGSDAGALRIETGEIRGRMTLRVIYPEDQIVYRGMGRGSRTTMRVRDDGTWGGSWRNGRRVTVTGSGRGLEAFADLKITVPRGGKVSTFVGAGKVTVSNVEGDLVVDTHSGSVKADGVRGSLLVDTGSGRVNVSRVIGNLDIDTGSGSVSLADCRSDRIVVDTGSGRVTGEGLEAPYIEIDTGSGSIDIQKVRGEELRLDTGSGAVTLSLLTDIRFVNIDTGSGGVTLTVPATLGAQLEVDTGSGGISVDVPIEYRKKSRSYVFGTIGDGKGKIIIDTGSGRVRIRKP